MRGDARKRSLSERVFDAVQGHPLVGVIGKKRHGKDTFASALVDTRGFTRVAFADPLKEAALALDPIILPAPGEAVTISLETAATMGLPRLSEVVARDGWDRAKENPEVRRTLQDFGVGIRGIDVDFWVRAGMGQAAAVGGPVVITDVRFPNEADAILQAGGTLVRVVRPDVESFDTHASETALDRYVVPLVALNVGTVEDLRKTALSMF